MNWNFAARLLTRCNRFQTLPIFIYNCLLSYVYFNITCIGSPVWLSDVVVCPLIIYFFLLSTIKFNLMSDYRRCWPICQLLNSSIQTAIYISFIFLINKRASNNTHNNSIINNNTTNTTNDNMHTRFIYLLIISIMCSKCNRVNCCYKRHVQSQSMVCFGLVSCERFSLFSVFYSNFSLTFQ